MSHRFFLVVRGLMLILGFLVLCFLTVPGFMAYRGQATAQALLPVATAIQRALTQSIATTSDQRVPSTTVLYDYPTLRALVKAQGGTLPATTSQAGFILESYVVHPRTDDGQAASYT